MPDPDPVVRENQNRIQRRNLLLVGTAMGFFYGLAGRLLYLAVPRIYGSFVMTAGFTCFVPFAMGCVTVWVAEFRQRRRWSTWLMLPWVPLAAALVATMLVLLEGLICVIMFAPLGFALSTLGGLAGGLAGRYMRSRRLQNLTVACVMVLPFFTAPWEKHVLYHPELRNVETVIDIQAPASVVWRNIERVPAIGPGELPRSWIHSIGFPDPVEATLSHEGIGGVRNATFTGGVLFPETVDVWEPERRLAFSIHAQTVPRATLDEHVRIGGPYFDVLRGEYRLEPLAGGATRLHLASQHRVSTGFNWYAHLWTTTIMADLQNRILHVVQQRCELAARAGLP